MKQIQDKNTRKHGKGRIAILFVIIGVAIFAYYFGYDQPARQYRQDNGKIITATETLMKSSEELEKTNSLAAFTDISELTIARQADLARVTALINKNQALVDNLDKAAAHNPNPFLFSFNHEYSLLVAQKNRARAVVNQSRQVLAAHSKLVQFVGEFGAINDEYYKVTAKLAGTSNLDDYATRVDELVADQESLQGLTDRVTNIAAPDELTGLKTSAANILKEITAGYGDFVAAMRFPTDDGISAAAKRIDDAMMKYDKDIASRYGNIILDTRTMKETGDLPDKFVIESFE